MVKPTKMKVTALLANQNQQNGHMWYLFAEGLSHSYEGYQGPSAPRNARNDLSVTQDLGTTCFCMDITDNFNFSWQNS